MMIEIIFIGVVGIIFIAAVLTAYYFHTHD